MKNIVILGVIGVLTVMLFLPRNVLPNEVYFRGEDFSGKSVNTLIEELRQLSNTELTIDIEGNSLNNKISEMGIEIDTENEIAEVINNYRGVNLWTQLTQKRAPSIIRPTVEITDKFEEIITRIVTKDSLELETELMKLEPISKKITLNKEMLEKQFDREEIHLNLKQAIWNGDTKVTLERIVKNEEVVERWRQLNTRLDALVKTQVKVGEIAILGSQLIDYIEMQWDRNEVLSTKIIEDKIPNQLVQKYEIPKIIYESDQIIKEHLAGKSFGKINWGKDDGPSTSGEWNNYLEIDLSSQKLYLFSGGQVKKTYKISTGKYYKTPPGEYSIFNKIPLAYSKIFDAWMPYWMAFSYRSDVGAWLGIHEIAYHVENKQKSYPYGDYIGEQGTGGCVALSPKESKELYDQVAVGTKVVIVN